jgi:hypothetical protein
MSNTTTKFKGRKAKTIDGRIVFVVNETVNAAGEKMVKVAFGRLSGYGGWSGGSTPVYAWGDAVWIKKERLA